MSPKKSERRHKVRFDVEGLHGGVRLPSDARIVDLGFGGLGVETDRWLQVGRGYTVSLPTGAAPVRIQGTVAWCRLARTAKNDAGESAPVYKAGIQFQETDPSTIEAIEKLLSSSARVGAEDTIRGRFRYRREESVDVELGHPFVVRKMSLTGMLVEAGFIPAAEERFRVAIDLGGEVLEVTVRVAYVDRAQSDDEGDPMARIGVEFVDLDGEGKKLLRSVIRSEVASSSAPFVGNPETGVYHRGDCHHAPGCNTTFTSRRQAERAGLRVGSCCAE